MACNEWCRYLVGVAERFNGLRKLIILFLWTLFVIWSKSFPTKINSLLICITNRITKALRTNVHGVHLCWGEDKGSICWLDIAKTTLSKAKEATNCKGLQRNLKFHQFIIECLEWSVLRPFPMQTVKHSRQ